MIRDHHDDLMHGYPGVTRTMELIRRNYNAPRLRLRVEQYIKECIKCQQNKSARYKPYRKIQFAPVPKTPWDDVTQQNKSARHKLYGKIQFAPVPKTPWDDVTMDFITKLPKSKDPTTSEVYNAIMVIVDRLMKYTIIIPFKEKHNTKQLIFMLLDRLIRDYSIPKLIILDRDKLFTSNY